MLTDGSQAFEIKDFLVQQERCKEVTIDNRPYYGKGYKVSVFAWLVCTIREFDVYSSLALGRQEEGQRKRKRKRKRTVNTMTRSFFNLSLSRHVQSPTKFSPRS